MTGQMNRTEVTACYRHPGGQSIAIEEERLGASSLRSAQVATRTIAAAGLRDEVVVATPERLDEVQLPGRPWEGVGDACWVSYSRAGVGSDANDHA